MALHNHHSHECGHEDVTYCKRCKVVYCEDCTQTWTAQAMTYTTTSLGTFRGSQYTNIHTH